MNFILLPGIFLFLLCSCQEHKESPAPTPERATAVQAPSLGCAGCHDKVRLDEHHDFSCIDCHQGNNSSDKKYIAHEGLLTSPAAPDNMEEVCGRCHADQSTACAQSGHFTLKNAVNLIRSHFDLEPSLTGLTEILISSHPPENKEQLVDDLLRRYCLRCHPFTKGDSYPYVRRGKGCAVCHLQYTDGKLESHSFLAVPGERQCLSCHYGNHVGMDFIGKYEHDYNDEYRTPYTTAAPFARPYGVEQHDLVPDIHQQRGLTCLDCHSRGELSGRQQPVQCLTCHSSVPAGPPPSLHNVRLDGDKLLLTAVKDGQEHPVPALRHPAHTTYIDKVACQVCHAQWGFNDGPAHLLLSYAEDVEPWEYLTVQSSSEMENFLFNNLYEDERAPSMPDTLIGKIKPGIWYKGYTERRWADLLIRRDIDGMVKVFRPILDLRLSASDKNGRVIAGLDNVTGNGSGLLPYTPHTTGPAGLFYEQRFLHLLDAQVDPK